MSEFQIVRGFRDCIEENGSCGGLRVRKRYKCGWSVRLVGEYFLKTEWVCHSNGRNLLVTVKVSVLSTLYLWIHGSIEYSKHCGDLTGKA